MGLYNKYILPKVIDWTCKQGPNMKQREKVVPLATGNILEIGIGSGLNLPFYNLQNVDRLTAIDPSEEIWNQNSFETDNLPYDFEFIKAFAENIPAEDNSFDSVVFTYTLCSIPNVEEALSEIRRVLKNNGQVFFCEHGKAPDKMIQNWQNYLNPIWKKFGGGCNLNRDIPRILENNGLQINQLDTMYIPGLKAASFNYWGTAGIR